MSTQKKGKNDAEVGGFFLERRDFSGPELVAPALGIIHGLKPIFLKAFKSGWKQFWRIIFLCIQSLITTLTLM